MKNVPNPGPPSYDGGPGFFSYTIYLDGTLYRFSSVFIDFIQNILINYSFCFSKQ